MALSLFWSSPSGTRRGPVYTCVAGLIWSRKYLPLRSIPSRISPWSSSRFSAFWARGIVAWKPAVMAGVTIMKMMSSTSITSIIGVTLMSARTGTLELPVDRATGLRRLLGLEFLGEDRPAELAADALDQVVDQFLGRVRHLYGQEVDLRGEEVVEPHRRDRDHEAERRGDQRLGYPARDGRQGPAAARGGHTLERRHDAHRGPEQPHERRRRAHRRENAQSALQLGGDDQHLPLHRSLGRVDVGCGDRRAVPQQWLDYGQRFAEPPRHVTDLVLLSESDRAVELLLLQEPRELRRKFRRLFLRFPQVPPLRERDGPVPQGHDQHHDHDGLGEQAHGLP